VSGSGGADVFGLFIGVDTNVGYFAMKVGEPTWPLDA